MGKTANKLETKDEARPERSERIVTSVGIQRVGEFSYQVYLIKTQGDRVVEKTPILPANGDVREVAELRFKVTVANELFKKAGNESLE
jgi:hypothetical protein